MSISLSKCLTEKKYVLLLCSADQIKTYKIKLKDF
jgi:hypothetical protein